MQNARQVETHIHRYHLSLAWDIDSAERNVTGGIISPEMIAEYPAFLQDKRQVKGTLEWYRRSLQRPYNKLPKQNKYIYRNTLQDWREKLVRKEYTPTTIYQFMVDIVLLVEQAQERMLGQEQFIIGWEE